MGLAGLSICAPPQKLSWFWRRRRVASAKGKGLGGHGDDAEGDDGREHGGIDGRVKQEQAAQGGADGQRDKHARQSPPLFAGQKLEVAEKKDKGGGRSGGKDAADVKSSNRSALHSHRQRPDRQESERGATVGPTAEGKPNRNEAEMRQQRSSKS